MSTHPNHHRGEERRQDHGPSEGRHAARGRAKWRRRQRRGERRRLALEVAIDAIQGILIILGLVACGAEPPYDGPLWGDPCEMARTDPTVTLYACHWDGAGYQLGVCQELAPGAAVGACRPFCGAGASCAAGVPTAGPLGRCFCAEESP